MYEKLNHLKKSSPIFYYLHKNKKFFLIPPFLFLIILNIHNIFFPKLYNVELNARVIDIYKFINLNSFIKKNENSFLVTTENLANQIADSFTDYGEIEDAVRKYSEEINSSKLTKIQKDKLIWKLTQSYSLDTINHNEKLNRLEKFKPYKMHNRFDFLIQFNTKNISNSIIILEEAIKNINQDINQMNISILNNVIKARLSNLERNLTEKKMKREILKKSIAKNNNTKILVLEEQLKLFSLRDKEEKINKKYKKLEDNKNLISVLEKQLELIRSRQGQEKKDKWAKETRTDFDESYEAYVLKIETELIEAKNLIVDNQLNTQSNFENLYNEKETELIKAKNLRNKFIYNLEYRRLQEDIELLDLQISNIKDSFNDIIMNTPFYKNENIISLEKSTIKIDDPNELSTLIKRNIATLLIGILFGLSLIIFRDKKTIFN